MKIGYSEVGEISKIFWGLSNVSITCWVFSNLELSNLVFTNWKSSNKLSVIVLVESGLCTIEISNSLEVIES